MVTPTAAQAASPLSSLRIFFLICVFGTIAVRGLLLGASPEGRRRNHQHLPSKQGPLHAVNIILGSRSSSSSRKRSSNSHVRTLDVRAQTSTSERSNINEICDSKLTGFGSRASRRRKRVQQVGDGLAASAPVVVLKRSNRWACVKNCGACCYLAPKERPDLEEYLPDPAELDLYMSMANEDGWCKHFDKKNRACTIYTERPRFCRVETETFGSMFGVDPEDMDEFCSGCCNEQITDVYGPDSKELRTFNNAIAALERGERPKPELSAFGGDLRGAGEGQIRDWGLHSEAIT